MSANRFTRSFYSPATSAKSRMNARRGTRLRAASESAARVMVEGLETRQMLSVSGNELGYGVAHYTKGGTDYVVAVGQQTETGLVFAAQYKIAADGVLTPDPAFGTAGVLKLNATTLTMVRDVAVDSAGVIYVAGAKGDELSVAAIKLDTLSNQYVATSLGSLSTSSDAGTPDFASSIAVYDANPDPLIVNEKVIVGGNASSIPLGTSQFLVAQFNLAGGLDASFGGGDGWSADSIGGNPNSQIEDVIVSGGTIYAGGSTTDAGGSSSFALATYGFNGAISGTKVTPHTGVDTLNALAATPSGDAVLGVGFTANGALNLIRYATGSLAVTEPEVAISQGVFSAVSVAVDASGGITVAGRLPVGDAMAVRITPVDDGSGGVMYMGDSNFGIDGLVTLTGLSDARAATVAGNRIIAVGGHTGATLDLAVAVADATAGVFKDNDFIDLPIGDEPPPPVPGQLSVDATNGNDAISVTLDADGNYWVQIGNVTVSHTNPALVTELVIHGGDGNDNITIGAGIMGATIYGGAGNDTVTGGGGDDLIFGETGNDAISGGSGADVISGGDGTDDVSGGAGLDVLIGGKGADKLTGSAGDDVLIAGYTDWDSSPAELNQIREIWTSPQLYVVRVLQLGLGLLLGDNVFGVLTVNGYVHDDAAADNLTGASGDDFFIANIDGGVKDKITDRGELVWDIDLV